MVVAEEYAKQQALLVPAGVECIGRLTSHVEMLLKELPQLANELRNLDIGLITEKFDNDKKHQADRYRIVVPKGNGALEIEGIPRTEQGRADIKEAYRAAVERLIKLY